MTCTDMLIRLLEAERAELAGDGTSPLAAHIRSCARCRAVASQLLSDTNVLAACVGATEAKPRPTWRARTRPLVWGGALLATSVALLLIPRHVAHVTIDAHNPPVVRASAPPETLTSNDHASKPGTREPVAVRATPFEPVAAATAVRFAESQAVEAPPPPADSNNVAVAPPADKRAMVLATRNARITVVWLY